MWLSHGELAAGLAPLMLAMFRTINHRATLTWLGKSITGATGAVTDHHMKRHAQHAFVLFLHKYVSVLTLNDCLQPDMPSRDDEDRLA